MSSSSPLYAARVIRYANSPAFAMMNMITAAEIVERFSACQTSFTPTSR